MTAKIFALFREEDQIVFKINEAITEAIKGLDINSTRQSDYEKVENPEFVIVRIDNFNIRELELIKARCGDSGPLWDNAIKYFMKRNKSKK